MLRGRGTEEAAHPEFASAISPGLETGTAWYRPAVTAVSIASVSVASISVASVSVSIASSLLSILTEMVSPAARLAATSSACHRRRLHL